MLHFDKLGILILSMEAALFTTSKRMGLGGVEVSNRLLPVALAD
jgi:hypothetical protein